MFDIKDINFKDNIYIMEIDNLIDFKDKNKYNYLSFSENYHYNTPLNNIIKE